ncbi:MAG: SulP family inorganic anion transporter [Caldilineaceae bacterium]|nr:SulP family inorganic anion transporter [Caldilineaceae bacterium]MCB9137990.1 SulP family inorganic anion transporter [Caldilineaceae bacterium]
MERWLPIAVWLPKYDWGKFFLVDLIAALSVAALLIPESMGYATVAGLPVQIGLYTAPLALIGYAMFGGSKILVYGAVGSVAAVTAGLLSYVGGGDQSTAVAAAAALALMGGIVFVLLGLLRLGWITNFMSHTIMDGFVFGMALQIIVGQLGKLTGFKMDDGNTVAKFWQWITNIGSWNMNAAIIGFLALILIFAIQRFMPKLPAALTAVILASVYVAMVSPNIDLVAKVPSGLPSIGLPSGLAGLGLADWGKLILGGSVVALVSFSEGWGASAKVSRETHDQLNSNQEFIAYGAGNIGAGLLGGMGAAGSLSKSSAALTAGAKTQMANIIMAGFVLLTLAFLSPLFQWLPEAVLGAVVINAMWDSANPEKLISKWKFDRIIGIGSIITAVIVLTVGLLPAMIIGIVGSILYLIYRISFPGRSELGENPETKEFVAIAWQYGQRHGKAHPEAKSIPGVIIYRMSAPLIFTNAEAYEQSAKDLLISAAADKALPHDLILDCEEIIYTDSTGCAALVSLHDYCKLYGVRVSLARVHSGTHALFKAGGVIDVIGEENVYPHIRDAVGAVTASSAR